MKEIHGLAYMIASIILLVLSAATFMHGDKLTAIYQMLWALFAYKTFHEIRADILREGENK